MSVQLLLAPAGGGKTTCAIARIRELRASDPLAPVWVVLPNFPQVDAFRRRLAGTGGAIGVEVGAFYRLYADLLACAGQPTPRLFDSVQHRLLRAIVDRLCDEEQLLHYAPLRDKPGFVRALHTLIRELKRARVHRDDLAAAVADRPPRLNELAAIYAAYQDWLVTGGWSDAEGQGWLAALALERDPTLYADLALLIVDGFDEFNPTQLAVLRLLADRAAETIVTLTGDPDHPDRTALRRFARARAALTQALDIEPSPITFPPPGLAPLVYLEENLFEPHPVRRAAEGAVEFIEAQHRRQEVRAALRWLKARIVQDEVSPGEVALLARDLSPYRHFLEEAEVEFRLPLYLAVGADLPSNPAVAALLALLSLPALDWPRRPVIETLASPYFVWSGVAEELPAQETLAARLDRVARADMVIQGLEQWREALDRLAEAASEEAGAAGEEEGISSIDRPIGEEAAALRRTFDRIVARLTPPAQATVRGHVAWVEGIIGDDPTLAHPAPPGDSGSLRIVAQARQAGDEPGGGRFARRDVAALQTFKDVLRGLVLSESLLQEQPAAVPYRRFFDDLRGAVEATTYTLPHPEKDHILVAPVFNARGLSFRAIALLGLSESEFPAAEREDPLLREEERALLRERGLALEPRLRSDEATLFYEAVTRARERLLLCRPYLADDGQTWEPSPYWRHLRLLVDAPLQRARPAELVPDEAASPQEFLAALAQAGASPDPASEEDAIGQGWRIALAGAEVVRTRLARSPDGPHEGDLGPLTPTLASRYGPSHVWSSSRLETYAKCPLQFYVAHVLHLEPRTPPQEGFDQLILGSIYHKVLEDVYTLAPADPLSALPEVTQEIFTAAPDEYGFRPTPLWEQQQREFLQVLEKTIVALEETRVGYEPYAQEPPFGLHGAPPLTLQYPVASSQYSGVSSQYPVVSSQYSGVSVQIRGYIDRVDRAPDGSLRVIDYKAGSSRISARELEEGTRLQLPLYALAVRDALGMGPVVDGFYWHIGSASPSYLRLERYEGGVEGAAETATGYVKAYVAGVREGRFHPTPPAGGCPDHCPAVGFCWRYAPRGW